ncbi:hypothetical protein AUEXF2481DRAFT_75293 [Aureobasidium subglaciale EXF-2481]|uniref:BTB domain-containing protein n=1 Tax=Aureobasidium subglaciale (strain EXF-2481) TaxID=1043005 RepID=A0A074ZPD3_AURSE|nr:uncharacterized protein AUEXF2481DRAFT_75293 [Aureobasidium subglaciale EXF-2481]KAI5212225.1 hypothetical protein E4T38_00803 [Aureobasidium subglaciale]KAI5231229.1 hypothetical protein E4T40_00804 [Aureobasidium subglaciale]KAI5234101.1 hypothetical protein E4T41_00802 [Aureobasidium subglaciale]KAI5267519.1 hypothetical protein E4T46_00802 [Aureobasidium subglaciale]KER00167.1 hypothetical protein AUEXF2481DRAFT_75293 [Aureobasidium subglaciale EXF-2481]
MMRGFFQRFAYTVAQREPSHIDKYEDPHTDYDEYRVPGHFTIDEDLITKVLKMGDNEISNMQHEDLVDDHADIPEAPASKPTSLFAMSMIKVEEVVPLVPVGKEAGDDDDEGAVDESWIPLDPNIAPPYIEVIVGGIAFPVSKHLLASCPTFFERALNGAFREANESKISLDERLDLFLVFHTWLFSRNDLDFVEKGFGGRNDTDAEERQMAYIEIYIFADRLDIPKLANAALQQLDKAIRPEGFPFRFSIAAVCLACESVPESSSLWKYILAIERDANRCCFPSRTAKEYEHLPGLFFFGLEKLKIDNQFIGLMKLKKAVSIMGGYERVERSLE